MRGNLRRAVMGTWSALPGLVCLLALIGCATTDEQRFPLTYISGNEVSRQPDVAREALAAYQRIGVDREKRGDFAEAAIAYSNAAATALVMGRLQDRLQTSTKAVEMAEHTGNSVHLAVALGRLGWAYLVLGAPQKALPLFERGVGVARQASPTTQAYIYTGLGDAYRRLGKPEKALEYAQRSVEVLESEVAKKRASPSYAGIQGGRSLTALENNYADALVKLGWNHLALRDWDAGGAAFRKALEVGSRTGVLDRSAEAHQGLGRIATAQRDFPNAVRHFEEVIRLSSQPGYVAWTQQALGRVYRDMGRLPEAEASLRQAIAGIEEVRSLLESEDLRESYFEDKTDAYSNLVQVLFDQGKVAQAFDITERARARAFLDLLGNRVTLSRGRSASLIAEERALRERISALKAQPEESPALRRELDLAREAYQAFLQRVRQVDREQASLMTVEPLTLAQVQALLPEGAVLLEYFMTGQGVTLLWTVERDSVSAVSLRVGRNAVTQRVQAFREMIASREREADTARMAQALFDQLVRPGLRDRQPRELLIVPHDALHYLPFQALLSGPGHYLIQDVPLYYYSSASLMQFTRAKAQAGTPTLFVMGNPDLQDPRLNLRYAEREVRDIAALFPGTLVLTGKAATKATNLEQSPRHRILHFATHAELDQADPLGSALRLAPANGDDGRLEVQEIFGLNLHASLVVLSACETALGTLTRGDELTGLTRAFIYAGTPSVITTLWQVNDLASYELMQAFYRHLQAGEDKAEALRQAQLAVMQRHPPPYYWAAYQLTGEAR